MKIWIPILFLGGSALAQNINITNVPVAAGFAPTDTLLGITNGHTALYRASSFATPNVKAIGTNTFSISSGDPSLIIGTNPPVAANYVIAPGVYWCSNWMKCPTNGSIVGSGAGATILIDMFTNGLPVALINPSDNGYVSDLTITNFWADALAGGVPAACIGVHQSVCTTNGGGAVISGSGGYSNFLGERLILYGGSDTFYNRHTNSCQGVIQSSTLYGAWDVCTAFNAGKQTYDFKYCNFIHIPVQSHVNAYDIFVAQDSTNLTRFWYCNFYMSNGVPGKASFLWNTVSPSTQTTQAVEFHYCTFTNAVPNALASPPIHVADSGQPVLIEGGLGNLTALSVGVDDITTGINEIKWLPLVTTNITFGGSSGDGLGPRLTTTFPTAKSIISDSAYNAGGNPITNISIVNASYSQMSSNTTANQPSLAKGDNLSWSSNGVPFLVTVDNAGNRMTNCIGYGRATVQGSDATTTGQSLVDVTGLVLPLSANSTYDFEAVLSVSTTAVVTGTKYAVQFSQAGASVEAQIIASLTSTATASERINTLNTATANAYLTTSAQTGQVLIKGTLTTGANTGNISIQHLKVTSGTSTVFQKSTLKVTRAG